MKTLSFDPYIRIWNRIADHGEICCGGFDPKNDPDDRRKLIVYVLSALAFIILFVCFSSCTRKVYVPVERHTTVTEILMDTIVDIKLIECHDTVTVENAGKDTISYLHNEYAYSFASLHDGKLGHSLGTIPGTKLFDTLKIKHIIIRDSIPYPVTVEVERDLTFWQKIKIEYGGFAMGAAAAFAFIIGLMIFHNRKRKLY